MYFVKGVQRDIRAVFDRPLKHGAKECVVARDEGSMALRSAYRVGDTAHHRDVHQPIGGIRRRFAISQPTSADRRYAICPARLAPSAPSADGVAEPRRGEPNGTGCIGRHGRYDQSPSSSIKAQGNAHER
jgi:hypothetical protein